MVGQMNEWGSVKVHSTVDENHNTQKESLGICVLVLFKTFLGVHFCQEMQFWQNWNVLSEHVDIEEMFNPNKGDHLVWILSLCHILFCLFY